MSDALIRVLAAVLCRDGRYLIARRSTAARHGGLWEFPGGKVEPGETDDAALARELREELGLEHTRSGAVLFERRDPGSPYLIVFVAVETDESPVAREHEALAWATPAQLAAYPLAPSDAAFAAHLLGDGSAFPHPSEFA